MKIFTGTFYKYLNTIFYSAKQKSQNIFTANAFFGAFSQIMQMLFLLILLDQCQTTSTTPTTQRNHRIISSSEGSNAYDPNIITLEQENLRKSVIIHTLNQVNLYIAKHDFYDIIEVCHKETFSCDTYDSKLFFYFYIFNLEEKKTANDVTVGDFKDFFKHYHTEKIEDFYDGLCNIIENEKKNIENHLQILKNLKELLFDTEIVLIYTVKVMKRHLEELETLFCEVFDKIKNKRNLFSTKIRDHECRFCSSFHPFEDIFISSIPKFLNFIFDEFIIFGNLNKEVDLFQKNYSEIYELLNVVINKEIKLEEIYCVDFKNILEPFVFELCHVTPHTREYMIKRMKSIISSKLKNYLKIGPRDKLGEKLPEIVIQERFIPFYTNLKEKLDKVSKRWSEKTLVSLTISSENKKNTISKRKKLADLILIHMKEFITMELLLKHSNMFWNMFVMCKQIKSDNFSYDADLDILSNLKIFYRSGYVKNIKDYFHISQSENTADIKYLCEINDILKNINSKITNIETNMKNYFLSVLSSDLMGSSKEEFKTLLNTKYSQLKEELENQFLKNTDKDLNEFFNKKKLKYIIFLQYCINQNT